MTDVQDHGSGVYVVAMRSQHPMPRFRAGQFLHLALDAYDPAGGFWPVSRVFSVARHPDPSEIWIAFSVKGVFTRRMSEELVEGREIWLKLPFGSFVVEASRHVEQDVVLVSGGTGIAPFVAFLEERLTSTPHAPYAVHLCYGVREPRLLLFRPLLVRCLRELSDFSLDIRVEKRGDIPEQELMERSRPGILDLESVAVDAGRLRSPVFFLSGPPAMIAAFRTGLDGRGVVPDRIRIDEWE